MPNGDPGSVGHGDLYRSGKFGMSNDWAQVVSIVRRGTGLIGGCSIDLRQSMIWHSSSFRHAAMIRPEHPKHQPGREMTGNAHPAPEPIFEPDLYQDLCDTIGAARLRVGLHELASALTTTFLENPPVKPDRSQIFQAAHMLTGRAGMMGFTALQQACADLQHACATQAPFRHEYAKARGIALASYDVITSMMDEAL